MQLFTRIILIATIAVLGVLSVGNPTVFASTIGSTDSVTTNVLVNITPTARHTWVFIPDANQTINKVTMYNDGTYGGTQTVTLLANDGSTIATSTGSGIGIVTYTFPTDINLVSGTKYAVMPSFYAMGYAVNKDSKGCKEYAYTPGTSLGTCGSGNTLPNSDIYLSLSWSYTFTKPELAIVFPETSQTYGDDFSHFQVTYVGHSAVSGQLKVVYGLQNSSTTLETALLGQSYPANSTSTQYLSKNPLEGMQWAQAQFVNIAGTILATSTIVEWSNQGYASTYTGKPLAYEPPFASSTNSLWLNADDPNSRWYVNCSDQTGWDVFSLSSMTCWFKKGVLQAVSFMIIPQIMNDDGSAWNDAIGYLKTGFPFNVMFGVLNSIQLAMTEHGYEPLMLPLDFGGATSSVELLSKDYASGLVGQTMWDDIQSLIGGALWLLLIFYIYYRANRMI